MSKAEDFVKKKSFVCDSKFHHIMIIDSLEAVRMERKECESRLAEEKKKVNLEIIDADLRAQDAFARGRLEGIKEVFEWLDVQLIKNNRLWRGETQDVLGEGEERFLSESKEKVKK